MAHELEMNKDGQARMFYAGELPWHGLGTGDEKEVTAEAAIRFARLDWAVEERPLYVQRPMTVNGWEVVKTHKAIVRSEDQKTLGIVGSGYQPIQNVEAFGFLDALVGEGCAMFHTAGSLFDGKRIFITCKMPDDIEVGPDKVNKYLALATSHDGSLSVHIKWTPVRVVCWNTLSAAFNIYGGKVHATDAVTVRHTINYKENMAEARRLLDLTDAYYKRVEACFNRLIATPMSEVAFEQFAEKLYEPTGKPDESGKPVVTAQCDKKRKEAMRLYHYGIGNMNPDVSGTRWAAYNAITEQVDHHKSYRESVLGGGTADARMTSIVWGSGAATKKRALEMLAETC